MAFVTSTCGISAKTFVGPSTIKSPTKYSDMFVGCGVVDSLVNETLLPPSYFSNLVNNTSTPSSPEPSTEPTAVAANSDSFSTPPQTSRHVLPKSDNLSPRSATSPLTEMMQLSDLNTSKLASPSSQQASPSRLTVFKPSKKVIKKKSMKTVTDSAMTMPDNYTVITTVSDAAAACTHLSTLRTVSVVYEGVDVSRSGALAWLICGCQGAAFLFNIALCGPAVFTDGGLGRLLEASSPVKVMHDCRPLSDLLYHQFNVCLSDDSVFDTQIGDIVIRYREAGEVPDTSNTLTECLTKYQDMPLDIIMIRESVLRENSSAWLHATVPPSLLIATARMARYLIPLYMHMLQTLTLPMPEITALYLESRHKPSSHNSGCKIGPGLRRILQPPERKPGYYVPDNVLNPALEEPQPGQEFFYSKPFKLKHNASEGARKIFSVPVNYVKEEEEEWDGCVQKESYHSYEQSDHATPSPVQSKGHLFTTPSMFSNGSDKSDVEIVCDPISPPPSIAALNNPSLRGSAIVWPDQHTDNVSKDTGPVMCDALSKLVEEIRKDSPAPYSSTAYMSTEQASREQQHYQACHDSRYTEEDRYSGRATPSSSTSELAVLCNGGGSVLRTLDHSTVVQGSVVRRLPSDSSSSGEDVVIEREMPLLVPNISSYPMQTVQSQPTTPTSHRNNPGPIPQPSTTPTTSQPSSCIRSIGRGRGFIRGPAKQQNLASLRHPNQPSNQQPGQFPNSIQRLSQLPKSNQCIGRGRASTTQSSVGRGKGLVPTSGAGRGALLNNPQLCQSFGEPELFTGPVLNASKASSDSSAASEPFNNYHDYYNRTSTKIKKDSVQVCYASDSDDIHSD